MEGTRRPRERPEVDREPGVDDRVAPRARKGGVKDVDALLGGDEEPVAGRVVGEILPCLHQRGNARLAHDREHGQPGSGPDAGSMFATFASGFSLAHRPRSDTGAVDSSLDLQAIALHGLFGDNSLASHPTCSSMIWPMYEIA